MECSRRGAVLLDLVFYYLEFKLYLKKFVISLKDFVRPGGKWFGRRVVVTSNQKKSSAPKTISISISDFKISCWSRLETIERMMTTDDVSAVASRNFADGPAVFVKEKSPGTTRKPWPICFFYNFHTYRILLVKKMIGTSLSSVNNKWRNICRYIFKPKRYQ